MKIDQSLLEFIISLTIIFGAFYKIAKAEERIDIRIIGAIKKIEIHEKSHELLEYKIDQIEARIMDCCEILKRQSD